MQIAQGLIDEDGEFRDRDGNVCAQIAPAASLRLDHRLAIEPQAFGLRAARGDGAVGDQILRVAQERLEQCTKIDRRAGGELHQNISRISPFERFRHVVARTNGDLEPISKDQLEGSDEIAAAPARPRVERHRVGHRAKRDEGGLDLSGLREELQGRSGHDAQRSLTADEELLEIVAAIVFAEHIETVPDAPVAEHHLEAQNEVSRHAVAQHVDPAGVGGDVAADAARALRAESDREQAIRCLRRLLGVFENASGFDDHRKIDRIDHAHRVEPVEADYELSAAGSGHRSADETRKAALRDDGKPAFAAESHDGRGLLSAARTRNRQRPAIMIARPIPAETGEILVRRQKTALRQDCVERGDRFSA